MTDRLGRIADLVATHAPDERDNEDAGRNLWTRTLDAVFGFIRRHLRPLHLLEVILTAVILYVYARLVALTARLATSGEVRWPNMHVPGVIALWHSNAPSLLVAFAKNRPCASTVILIASDARGDFLALLCRMLGFDVVRTSNVHGDWHPLVELADRLRQGACVIITADGGGPAKIAKVGAIALASATGVPLTPMAADCYPAIQQNHKWDVARNPLPFSSVRVWMGTPRTFEPFADWTSIECARTWLEQTLNERA